MANQEHLNIIQQGVATWNEWREKNPELVPDLTGADLCGADIREADLRGLNCSTQISTTQTLPDAASTACRCGTYR
jgi:uncharacterized protein YjbI with pentapeptide repeats